jgi:hypothetical protein
LSEYASAQTGIRVTLISVVTFFASINYAVTTEVTFNYTKFITTITIGVVTVVTLLRCFLDAIAATFDRTVGATTIIIRIVTVVTILGRVI